MIKFNKHSVWCWDYYVVWGQYADPDSVGVPQLRDDGTLRLGGAGGGMFNHVRGVLDTAYPLPAGLKWGVMESGYNQYLVRPDLVEGENPFDLIEAGRENEVWLVFGDGLGNKNINLPEIGQTVSARERGGFTKVTVEEVLHYRGFVWVRGRWSEGDYLPVEKFLADLEVVALRIGAPV